METLTEQPVLGHAGVRIGGSRVRPGAAVPQQGHGLELKIPGRLEGGGGRALRAMKSILKRGQATCRQFQLISEQIAII